ncbi:Chitinase 2 [Coemansia spiralis]|uniref:chitinase n=1 Tax=Coemansia spiralis TaxID=417178 RepID=A0A9W8L760_9FUNG|nr:Chitinase 2 [Coemansia spiralis]
MKLFSTALAALATLAGCVTAFNVNCNSNYASYYGQNSARNQKTLGSYCADATEDVIVLAFMNGFPNIILNFANACETTFEGSSLLHCPNIAADIKYCQSQGKVVILSMGGAAGSYGFSSDSQASQFADTTWNMFFKGTAAQRPFDDAVLDGIDLDIEGGGTSGYTAFISQLRSHFASDPGRQYYIAAAPQCPFPDAYLGSTLNSGWFDMVYVQFYNNYCGLNAYPTWFNFADWDNWAKTQSINKNVKVYIGAPGSPSAASSGYIDGSTLSTIFNAVRSKYTSLGGIMTWDVSQARTSGLAGSIRAMLDSGGSCSGGGPPSSTSTTSSSSKTTSATSTSSTATTAPAYSTANPSSTTAVSSTTTTSSSSQPSSSSTPASCPVSGATCSGGQQGCNGQSFALCNQGKWYTSPCTPGTYCYMSGGVATCDWSNGRPTNTCAISGSSSFSRRTDLTKTSLITAANLRPKPASAIANIPTRVEFVVGDIVDDKYTTVVKIQANKSAFTGNWLISFKLPTGQTAETTSRGNLSVNGSTVTISSDRSVESLQNMAAFFKITGTFTGHYALPDAASAVFLST